MKKIGLILLIVVFLLIAKCGHSIYKSFRDFPEYATEEVLSKQYQQLISDIDAQIECGNTLFAIGANLEKINYPSNTIYVVLTDDEDEETVVLGKKHSSRSSVLINGFGHGKLNGQEVVIVQRPVNKAGIEEVIVYLQHDSSLDN